MHSTTLLLSTLFIALFAPQSAALTRPVNINAESINLNMAARIDQDPPEYRAIAAREPSPYIPSSRPWL
uniref:Uncharacterized protein n=1 Tax=Mycena chlorophos TaxID=658473 RepID=A0ABQ0LZH7_MYCCL|nr:predicted protein [Mycena chlorophos]